MLAENVLMRNRLVWTSVATLIFIIGSITGLMEIRRALIKSPLPISGCDFVQAWQQSPSAGAPMTEYLLGCQVVMPEWMRPQSPVSVPPGTIGWCFSQ